MSDILIISPWGQPAFWGERTYVYDGFEVTSCTSLKLIYDMYRRLCNGEVAKKVNSVTVYVLCLESIVDVDIERLKSSKEKSRCREFFISKSRLRLINRVKNRIRGIRCGKDYVGRIYGSIRKLVKNLLNYLGIGDNTCITVKPIVLPAIGKPGNLIRYEGDVKDFHSLALIKIGMDIIRKGLSVDEIVVDLTHGINFMPTYTYQLARELGSLSLLISNAEDREKGKHVKLILYNSDPSPHSNNKLNLNVVSEESINEVFIPRLSSEIIKWKSKLEPPKYFRDARSEVSNNVGKYVNHVILSIKYPLPLILAYLGKGIPKRVLYDILSRAREAWVRGIEVSSKGGEVIVRRKVSLDPESTYATLIAYTIVSIIRRLRSNPLTLSSIKSLNERIYKYVSNIHYNLIEHELSTIERLRTHIRGAQTLYSLKGGERRQAQKVFDKRIAIAHAGLQKEFILIRKVRNDVELRYITPSGKRYRKLTFKDINALINMVRPLK